MEPRKQAIMEALRTFVAQRPGFDPGNYDRAGYLADSRMVQRQARDFRELARAVESTDGITADALMEAARSAFSGRLEIAEFPEGPHVTYTAGQYVCTEYRAAACATMARALWDWTREHAMPAPIKHRVKNYHGDANPSALPELHAACEERNRRGADTCYLEDYYRAPGNPDKLLRAADWLRAHFRREFGRGIQSRWFS